MKKIFLFLFFCNSFIQPSDQQSEQNNKELIDLIQKRAHLLKLQTFLLLAPVTIGMMQLAFEPWAITQVIAVIGITPLAIVTCHSCIVSIERAITPLLFDASSQDLKKIAAAQNFNRFLYFLAAHPNCAQRELQWRHLQNLEELRSHGPEYAAIAALTNERRKNITLAETLARLLLQEPRLERKQPI